MDLVEFVSSGSERRGCRMLMCSHLNQELWKTSNMLQIRDLGRENLSLKKYVAQSL